MNKVNWSNPITRNLVAAIYPDSSNLINRGIRSTKGKHISVRGAQYYKPIVAPVENSTVLIVDICTAPDSGGTWWNAQEAVYADSSSVWPNDQGIKIWSCQLYGNMTVVVRNTIGDTKTATIDVYNGALIPDSGQRLIRVVTIDSSYLVRAWGNGIYGGSSAGLQGFTYSPTSITRGGASFGVPIGAAGDTVTSQALALRWARVLSDTEIASISKNPWQIFQAEPTTYVGEAAVTIAVPDTPVKPISDIETTGWYASGAASHVNTLNEDVASDLEYVYTSPTTGYIAPLVLGLNTPMSAGTYTIQVRAKIAVPAASTPSVKITLLNDSNAEVGVSEPRPLSNTYTTYPLAVTTTGSATKLKIEVI